MHLDRTHPEDVKAAIRKRFGTISRFIEENDLPTTGVSDLLRGRTSARVRKAVEEVLKDSSQSNEVDSLHKGAARAGKGSRVHGGAKA